MKKQITIRIEDGKTIISTGVKAGDPRNKTGVKGMNFNKDCGTYTLSVTHNGKKYHIGNYATIEEGKSMRKKCDKYIEDGIFEQWVNDLPNKRIINQLGVKGLSKKGNMYQMNISYKNKKYFLGSFTTPDQARPVREAAEKHMKDGTFEEWVKNLPSKIKSNSLGVKGLSKCRNTYQLSISYKNKQYHLGSFSIPEQAKPIREEAEKQIEAGTFEEWLEELRKSRKKK